MRSHDDEGSMHNGQGVTPSRLGHGPFVMPGSFSGEQVRQAEQPLLNLGQGDQLMRRAAYGLASHVIELLKASGGVFGATVTGLIGSGNNGGDGLYALAYLARRGVQAQALLMREKCHAAALEAFLAAGGRVSQRVSASTSVVIDSVLGTGISSRDEPKADAVSEVLTPLSRHSYSLVACDVPSGIDANTGQWLGPYDVRADHTVTFGAIKHGLIVGEGSQRSGRIQLVDIGLHPHLPQPTVHVLSDSIRTRAEHELPALHIAGPIPNVWGHKYTRGVAHITAGSSQYPGAAVLTVGAAVRTGTGMVTFDGAREASSQVLHAWPETVDLRGKIDALGLSGALRRASAVAVGPGLGEDDERLAAAEETIRFAASSGLPSVIDASGLQILTPDLLQEIQLGPQCVITPHAGEAKNIVEVFAAAGVLERAQARKLTGVLAADGEPLEAARQLSDLLGCTVLLKGASTVIAEPVPASGALAGARPPVLVHRAPSLGLSTAGSGDVLTGILVALLATGHSTQPTSHTCALAVRMHAEAAWNVDPEGFGHFGASALVSGIGSSRRAHWR